MIKLLPAIFMRTILIKIVGIDTVNIIKSGAFLQQIL
jgi:hypothetical protein